MGECVIKLKTTRHTETRCQVCGHVLDASSSVDGAIPKPGDISVCIDCGTILTFDGSLRLRIATDGEVAQLHEAEAKRLRQFSAAIRERTQNLSGGKTQ